MNTDQTTAEQQRVIQEEAASYALPEPQSHTLLMPHRESIANLVDRQRLKNWQKSFFAQVDSHQDVLLASTESPGRHE